MNWRNNLIGDNARISGILRDARRIAVLGIKIEAESYKPAFFVPEYLQRAGYDIVPVPVYYPDVAEILGKPVYRSLAGIPDPVDLVVVFRRPADIPPHVDDILDARPKAVWMQSGIRHAEAAQRLAETGIRVVQDRCVMIEHRMLI